VESQSLGKSVGQVEQLKQAAKSLVRDSVRDSHFSAHSIDTSLTS